MNFFKSKEERAIERKEEIDNNLQVSKHMAVFEGNLNLLEVEYIMEKGFELIAYGNSYNSPSIFYFKKVETIYFKKVEQQ